jgi:hypothetical protein
MKFSAEWVPKCLNAKQMCIPVLASQAILDRFLEILWDFFNRLITTDETWIYINSYDPQTKGQTRNWDTVVTTSKDVQGTEVIKQGVGICWNSACNYLESGAPIIAKFYVAFLDKVKQQLSICWGKLSKWIVSSRQCSSSQGSHYALDIGILSPWICNWNTLIWPFSSFLPQETPQGKSFQALGKPH